MAFPRTTYLLSWSEVVDRQGPGRRTALLGQESFGQDRISDLLLRLEGLLASGYEVRVRPPMAPPALRVVGGLPAGRSSADIGAAAA